MSDFRDDALINIVIYGAKAGILEKSMQEIQNTYAFITYENYSGQAFDLTCGNLPARNVSDVHTGYELVQSGKIN